MSVVSGVILTCCLMEEDTDNVARVNAWIRERHGGGELVNVADQAGGKKHPQCEIWIGGFNAMQEDEFVAFVLRLPWDEPSNMVLVIKPEKGPTRIWRATGGEPITIEGEVVETLSAP